MSKLSNPSSEVHIHNVAANSQYAVKHALDVHQHSSGKIWVACVQGTLMVADNTRSTSVTLQPSAFAGENVTTIAEDLSGRLWFGTSSGNIIMFDVYAPLTGESFHRILSVKGRINKPITEIVNLKFRDQLLTGLRDGPDNR